MLKNHYEVIYMWTWKELQKCIFSNLKPHFNELTQKKCFNELLKQDNDPPPGLSW